MSNDRAELVAVASFAQRFEADLAVSQLGAAGIEALISGPDAGGTLMAVPGGIRVLVHRAELEAASEVLRQPSEVERHDAPKRMKPLQWAALAFVLVCLGWILVLAFRNVGRV